MAMKFWIWAGAVPRGPDQLVTSTGVVVDPTPDAYYEVFVPMANQFEGAADERVHLTYYLIQVAPGRWMVANCWGAYFTGIDALVSNPKAVVARGASRAVREAFPHAWRLMENGKDPGRHDMSLIQADVDSSRKWLLATFVEDGGVVALDDFLERATPRVEEILRASVALLSETRVLVTDGVLAIPNLALYIGSEKDWIDGVVAAADSLEDLADVVQLVLGA